MNLCNYFTLFFVMIYFLTCAQSGNIKSTPSAIEASPHMVTIYREDLQKKRFYLGAGALITMKMVVSSSLTVYGETRKVIVVAGASKLFSNKHAREVKNVYLQLEMDLYITVVEVDIPFEEGPTIKIIQECNTDLNTVNEMEVSGWGAKAMCSSSSYPLIRTGKARIIKREECLPLFQSSESNLLKETMICGEEAEKGAVGVVNGEHCAIAAFAVNIGRSDLFVYADLSHPENKKFISSVVQEKCCSRRIEREFLTYISC